MGQISVIGLGAMGAALARTLIEAGYQVTVWNRTAAKAEPLLAAGATHAASPVDAILASPLTITCITSHKDTKALLAADPVALKGRTILELSTGDSEDAEALAHWLGDQGADSLIGMIAVFPGDVGKEDSAVVTVGQADVWERTAPVLRALGGRSSYVGENVGALAALFAGLFLPRQAFMFGMIYGALVCEKAGISMEDYVAQIPLTLKVVHDYYDLFAETVPAGRFDDPPASIGTYAAAFRDVLETFNANGAPSELPALLSGIMSRAAESGLAEKHVTVLTRAGLLR